MLDGHAGICHDATMPRAKTVAMVTKPRVVRRATPILRPDFREALWICYVMAGNNASQIARTVGVEPSTALRWINGKTIPPLLHQEQHLPHLRKLADSLRGHGVVGGPVVPEASKVDLLLIRLMALWDTFSDDTRELVACFVKAEESRHKPPP